MIQIRLGRGLGGKAFIIFTGDVAAVKSALRTVETMGESEGMVAKTVEIPSPRPDILQARRWLQI